MVTTRAVVSPSSASASTLPVQRGQSAPRSPASSSMATRPAGPSTGRNDGSLLPPPNVTRGATFDDGTQDGQDSTPGVFQAVAAFGSSKRVMRARRPLMLLYVIGALVLLSHAFTLHLTVATFLSRPRGREDVLPFPALRLLRKHAASVGGRKVAIISASTQHYATHVRNLVCTVRAAVGVTPVFFALDSGILQIARNEGIPVIDAQHERSLNGSKKPYRFQTPEFNYVSRLKLKAVRDTLLAGIDVLFTDVDVVFCDDAAKRLVERSKEKSWASMFIQNGRSYDWQWTVEPNTGFFYVKRTPGTIAMFDHLVEMIDKPNVAGLCDQFLFKRQVCEARNGDGEAVRNDTVPGRPLHFCQWQNGRVGVEILPLTTYPNGHRPLGASFGSLAPGQLRETCMAKEIVMFHNNYCDSGSKVQRMNSQGLWSVRRCSGKCQAMGPDEYGA